MVMYLEPTNKDIEPLECTNQFWKFVMIDLKVGEVLGVRSNTKGRFYSFFYIPDEENCCPMHNDGYYVFPELAKKMGEALDGQEESEEHNINRIAKFFKESNGFLIL